MSHQERLFLDVTTIELKGPKGSEDESRYYAIWDMLKEFGCLVVDLDEEQLDKEEIYKVLVRVVPRFGRSHIVLVMIENKIIYIWRHHFVIPYEDTEGKRKLKCKLCAKELVDNKDFEPHFYEGHCVVEGYNFQEIHKTSIMRDMFKLGLDSGVVIDD